MITPRVVFGYHGCDRSTLRKALDGETLRPSRNKYDWLGSGIYFWEDSPSRAERWARESAPGRPDVRNPAVLGAVLELKNCLNLTDPETIGMLQLAHQDFIKRCREASVPAPVNFGRDLGARFLDCAVMEHLHTLNESAGRPPFDSVRAFFTEGEPAYENAGFRILDHVQICIRNPRCIIGYFRPARVA
jgi:hypothetical protein